MSDAWGRPPAEGRHDSGPSRGQSQGYDPYRPQGQGVPYPRQSLEGGPVRVPLFDEPERYRTRSPETLAPRAEEDGEWTTDGATAPESVGRRADRQREATAVGRGRRSGLPGAVPALVLICLPLAAAVITGGSGLVFGAASVLGALVAAMLCSRPGVWWVATGAPPVVLLMALAGLVLSDSSARTSKLGTDLAKVVAGAFPVMGAALAAAAVVGVARLMAARGTKGNSRG